MGIHNGEGGPDSGTSALGGSDQSRAIKLRFSVIFLFAFIRWPTLPIVIVRCSRATT